MLARLFENVADDEMMNQLLNGWSGTGFLYTIRILRMRRFGYL